MSIPEKTREYRLPKAEGFHSLTLVERPIPRIKSTEVLLKVHAVSLQVRLPHMTYMSTSECNRGLSRLVS